MSMYIENIYGYTQETEITKDSYKNMNKILDKEFKRYIKYCVKYPYFLT